MNTKTLQKPAKQHLWHPCTQMKDHETFPPLDVVRAQGAYLEQADGRKIIDAISSWWCKALGHGHPRLRQALHAQAEQLEHVLLAGVTHETITKLSAQLGQLTQTLPKVFYASDGCCAIEIALKMSLHSRYLQGQPHRRGFMALANSYHGETGFALSVSDLGIYRDVYEPLLFKAGFLQNIPYVTGINDPLWHDCSAWWPTIEQQLNQAAEQLTAIIVEPIVQASAGMRIYSADFLRRLRIWTRQHQIHLIADEIAVGLGRTGLPLACQHAGIEPDFLCLGKGLTAGWLPMSAVLLPDAIYDLFYDDYEKGKSFLHSHTHSGNALAARVALECLAVMAEEQIYAKARALEHDLKTLLQEVADATGKLKNVRAIGGIAAAELITKNTQQRAGYHVYQQAVKLGALLRPISNTIYWFPPLNTDKETLQQLKTITEQAILLTQAEWS